MAVNLLMGFLAGLICSLGGALKDSPYEGFQRVKFFRSIVVGLAWGLVSFWFTRDPIVAFVFSGYCERVTVEGWKLVRAQRPGKFLLQHPALLGAHLGFSKRRELTGVRQ